VGSRQSDAGRGAHEAEFDDGVVAEQHDRVGRRWLAEGRSFRFPRG
jgi:hypothetical protein